MVPDPIRLLTPFGYCIDRLLDLLFLGDSSLSVSLLGPVIGEARVVAAVNYDFGKGAGGQVRFFCSYLLQLRTRSRLP